MSGITSVLSCIVGNSSEPESGDWAHEDYLRNMAEWLQSLSDPTGRINEIIAGIQVAAHTPTIDEYYIYTLNSPSGPVTRYARYITVTETRAPTVGNTQSGGGGDFSNTSSALDIIGGIFGGLDGLTSSQGYWLGKNGKYYVTSWGGNQHTGSRASALNAANQYKMAGRATLVGSVVLCGYLTYEGYVADGGQFGYFAQMEAASSVGSILGGLAGAKAGAFIGAGIGAWFGGVGAIPGAVIGGVIGGFGFGMAGGYYGGQLGGSAVNYYHGR